MEKECSSCGCVKPITDYQKRALSKDGVTASCKKCLKERDARRFAKDPRVRQRHKRYAKTDDGKLSLKKARSKWIENNADKNAAHTILNNAVRDGRASKPDTCSKCGASGRIEGHHHDYTLPLDVTWLCRKCHVAEHLESD